MKPYLVLLSLLLLFVPFSTIKAQSSKYSIAASIDTVNNANPDIKVVYRCWENYLKSYPDSIYDNPYWNDRDKEKYYSYDLLKSEGFLSPGLYAFDLWNQVISITDIGDKYIIRSVFYWPPSEKRNLYIMAITNVMAEKDKDGNFKLSNWIHHYTKPWYTRKVGIITYHYYPTYPFNPFEAEKANKLISFFKEKFGISVNQVEYYIAENCDAIMRLKGFDYIVGMGDNFTNLCGFYDRFNNIIYSNAKKGENYEHELTRLINNFFPNAHGMYLNGLSDYFIEDNNKMGLTLKEHFKRMDEHLNKHPEIDLNNLDSFYQMDNVTTPSYFLGVIITHMTLEKGGLELLKKGMNTAYNNESLYDFLDKEKIIKKNTLNKVLRSQIHKYATQDLKKIRL